MPEVNILIKAQDQASPVMDKVTGATRKLSDTTKSGASATKSIGMAYTELNSAVSLVQTGLQMLGTVYEKLVGGTVEYAKSVRDMARITGTGSEETSRLIQLTDDFGVSQQTLEQALKGTAQRGIQLTTEKLASMSDEYNALGTQTEKNTYLLDNFGKSGLDMAAVFDHTGAEIRDASGAIADNMVLTEAQVAKARELEIAQDNLNDALTGVGYTLGNEVIPRLVDAANATMTLLTASDQLNDALKSHSNDVAKTADSYAEYKAEMERANAAAGKVQASTLRSSTFHQQNALATAAAAGSIGMMTESEWLAVHAGGALANTEATAMTQWKATTAAANANTAAIDDNWKSTDAASARYQAIADQFAAQKVLMDDLTKAQTDYDAALQSWNNGAGSTMAQKLEAAGVKGDKLDQGLGVLDKTLGTTTQSAKRQDVAMEALAKEYASGRISAEQFGQKVAGLQSQFAPADAAITKTKGKLDELKAKIQEFQNLTIHVNVDYVEGGGGGNNGGTGENCFIAGTRVNTPGGLQPIETLQVGDAVLMRAASGDVIQVKIARLLGDVRSDIITARLSTGETITGAPNHPILTPSGWVCLSDLTAGDALIAITETWVVSIAPHPGAYQVYNFEIDHDEHTFLVEGVVVHNAEKLAMGTNYARGGVTLVGEQGPELVNMPRGSQVYTASETKSILSGGGSTNNVTYNIFTKDNPGQIKNAITLSRMMGGAA